MKLMNNLKKKMRAYSFWALLLSLVFFLLPEFVYAYTGRELASPYLVGGIAVFLGVFGLIGWGIDQSQPSLRRTAMLLGLSAIVSVLIYFALALPSFAMGVWPTTSASEEAEVSTVVTYEQTAVELVPLVKQWEGKHSCKDASELHCSYLDRIASPPLYTVCYGHTVTAAKGQRFNEAHCSALLQEDLRSYWAGVREGFTADTIELRLTPKRDAAFASLGYNVGVAGIRKSTATRRLNAGDVVGACDALTWWNKAGGRVVRGLVNRRAHEQAMCLEGVA